MIIRVLLDSDTPFAKKLGSKNAEVMWHVKGKVPLRDPAQLASFLESLGMDVSNAAKLGLGTLFALTSQDGKVTYQVDKSPDELGMKNGCTTVLSMNKKVIEAMLKKDPPVAQVAPPPAPVVVAPPPVVAAPVPVKVVVAPPVEVPPPKVATPPQTPPPAPPPPPALEVTRKLTLPVAALEPLPAPVVTPPPKKKVAPPPIPVDVQELVRRQVVVSKLTKFYRLYCPDKLSVVQTAYDNYKDCLPMLIEELTRRYALAPRDFFVDIMPIIDPKLLPPAPTFSPPPRGTFASPIRLATPQPDVSSFTVAPYHSDATQHIDQSVELLRAGASLLIESRPTQVPLHVPQLEHVEAVDDSAVLRGLIQGNNDLAWQVALAEQQVLQRRFEIMFMKQVEVPLRDRPELEGDLMQIIVRDTLQSNRVFSVAGCRAQWRYVLDSAVAAPHSPDIREMCTVEALSVSAQKGAQVQLEVPDVSAASEQYSVSRNILAMAMRVWSRRMPHTVSEPTTSNNTAARRGGGGTSSAFIFHPSTTLWWQWPSNCAITKGVAPVPMLRQVPTLDSALLPVSVMQRHNDASALLPTTRTAHPEVLRIFEDAPAVHPKRPVPWQPTAAGHKNQLSAEDPAQRGNSDFWSYFMMQWDMTSQQIAYGKASPQ